MKINEQQMIEKLQNDAFFQVEYNNKPVVIVTNETVYKAGGYSLKLSESLEKTIERS